MGWAVWLAIPVVLTAVVALLSWYRSRPVRTPATPAAMRAHAQYLDALVQTARSRDAVGRGGAGVRGESSRDD